MMAMLARLGIVLNCVFTILAVVLLWIAYTSPGSNIMAAWVLAAILVGIGMMLRYILAGRP